MKQKKCEEETKKITGTEMLSGEKQEQKEQTAEIKKIESPLAGTVNSVKRSTR